MDRWFEPSARNLKAPYQSAFAFKSCGFRTGTGNLSDEDTILKEK